MISRICGTHPILVFLRLCFVWVGVFCVTFVNASELQEPDAGQHVKITVSGVSNKALMDNIRNYVDLYDYQRIESDDDYIRYLADVGSIQIQQALQPFGYYRSKVVLKLHKSSGIWLAHYSVIIGPPIHVSDTDVRLIGSGASHQPFTRAFSQFPLARGDVLDQQSYETFKGKIAELATNYGYFDADFVTKAITVAENYRSADIALHYDTGKRYTFADTIIEQDFLDNDFFERFIKYHPGSPYSVQDIADLQRDLYNSDYISQLDLTLEPNTQTKTVPVHIVLQPKKNKKHTFAIGYSSDKGAKFDYNFKRRWVNRRGHKFHVDTYADEKQQHVRLDYIIPAKNPISDYYKFFVGAKRSTRPEMYDRLYQLGAAYHDQRGNFEREFGITLDQPHYDIDAKKVKPSLLIPYVKFTYRNVDDPINIKDGFLIRAEFSGAHQSFASEMSFFKAQVSAKMIKSISDKQRLKLSGSLGRLWSDELAMVPSEYKFVTGGDRSIRGYRYRSIGSGYDAGITRGGSHLYRASMEYEYFVKDDMAVAAFVDAGDAFSGGKSTVKVGAGIGFHYYSPIGPVRLDVAHGFEEPGSNVKLHINIGPEM